MSCLKGGYAPVVLGFLRMWSSNNLKNEFSELDVKIRNHLRSRPHCPSKQISQLDLNSTCYKIILSKVPGMEESFLMELQMNKPLVFAISQFIRKGDLDQFILNMSRLLAQKLEAADRSPKSPLKLAQLDSPLHVSCSYTHKVASPEHRRFEIMMKRMMSGEFKVKKASDKRKNKKQNLKVVFRGNSQDNNASGFDEEGEMSIVASSVNSSSMSNPKFPNEDQVSQALSFAVPKFREILEDSLTIVERILRENGASEDELKRLRNLYKEVCLVL